MESDIRDWLSNNLDFVEGGLRLIGKEYYLADDIGASGFIDLLCTDVFNNYVIIEIKKSNKSARHTMNEVLKYHSLISHIYKARASEIKIIVISTHWDELIRAYSEVYHKSSITIKGYKIDIDTNTELPFAINSVEPINNKIISRKFAYWQGFYLFKTSDKGKSFIEILKRKLSDIDFEDFVILHLTAPAENKKIITPWAILVAFQRQTQDFLLDAIRRLSLSELVDVMDKQEFDNESAYQTHLEGAFIAALHMTQYNDDAEAGYPEKLNGILSDQGWTIKGINRFGIFKKDPRYNDQLLINELRGLDGNNRNKFVGFAESTQIERIKELQQECINSLENSPQWLDFVEYLFNKLKDEKDKFRILMDIYNPDSIVTALYSTLIKANPLYLPKYIIYIDYFDSNKTKIFMGDIYWNKMHPTAKLFTSNDINEISNEVFRIQIDPDNLVDSFRMALFYTNRKIVIENNKEILTTLSTLTIMR